MLKVYDCRNIPLSKAINQLVFDFNLSQQKRVFIKPNLGGRYPIAKAENTAYDIVDAVCNALKGNDCQEIVIGHTSLLNFTQNRYNFDTLIKKSNFYKLRRYKIVKFMCLDDVRRFPVKRKDIEFNIPEILQTHFYINLCNLKTHMETTVSLSLKNQVGLLLASERMRKHRMDLDGHIAYLGTAVKPNLNIIDGRVGMEGNGPHHGTPKQADIIICADDMVAADSLATSLIAIDFKEVKHIKLAVEEKAGHPIGEKEINTYKRYFVKFQRPSKCYKKYRYLRVWPNKACSGCIFTLSDAHKTIRKRPFKLIRFMNKIFKAKKFDIVLGKGAESNISEYSDTIFAIGDCAKNLVKMKNLDRFLPGCPPKKTEIISFLTKGKK